MQATGARKLADDEELLAKARILTLSKDPAARREIDNYRTSYPGGRYATESALLLRLLNEGRD